MAILTRKTSQSAHWYSLNGEPAHRLPTADGRGERATTLADARRLGLLPSVTSILNALAKPQLDSWKLKQVAMAALRLPKTADESDDYWCQRVKAAAFEQVEAAAELGSRIHHALDKMIEGQPVPSELQPYINPVANWLARTGVRVTAREQVLVNLSEGFAGTADLFFTWGDGRGRGILDYKTKKTQSGKPVTPYDGQAMQLAAYAATHFGPQALPGVLAANIYISTTEPGRVEIVTHENLPLHWNAFRATAHLWRYLNGYDPRLPTGSDPTAA